MPTSDTHQLDLSLPGEGWFTDLARPLAERLSQDTRARAGAAFRQNRCVSNVVKTVLPDASASCQRERSCGEFKRSPQLSRGQQQFVKAQPARRDFQSISRLEAHSGDERAGPEGPSYSD